MNSISDCIDLKSISDDVDIDGSLRCDLSVSRDVDYNFLYSVHNYSRLTLLLDDFILEPLSSVIVDENDLISILSSPHFGGVCSNARLVLKSYGDKFKSSFYFDVVID